MAAIVAIRRHPSLSVLFPSGGRLLPPDDIWMLPRLGQFAEGVGISGLYFADHLLLGQAADGYPYGKFHHRPSTPYVEPLSVLAAIGAVTTRIRLGTHILLAALRPPAVLAKAVATVDRITRGRLELGVGVGWHRDEFGAGGLRFEDRGELLDDTIAGCRRLWRDSPATFRSRHIDFQNVYCEPKPTSPTGPPVLFAGSMSRRNQRRILEWGDGWIAPGVTDVDEVASGVRTLVAAFEAAGRDPARLAVRAALPVVTDAEGEARLIPTLAQAADFGAAGTTDVVVPVASFVRERSRLEPWLADLGAAWEHLETGPK